MDRLIKSIYRPEMAMNVSMERCYCNGVASARFLIVFDIWHECYRVYMDLISQRRLWRLWILNPRVFFIPYHFVLTDIP